MDNNYWYSCYLLAQFFFCSCTGSSYLLVFSLFFTSRISSVETVKFLNWKVLFLLLFAAKSGILADIGWSDSDLGYTIHHWGQTLVYCTIPSWPTCRACAWISFVPVYCIRILCDWQSHLYYYISLYCCSVYYQFFPLWCNLTWQHYFVQLLKEIQFSKLAQKEYKARHDWVGKVIHWEMCKKFKFDHANKWYMHNPAPVLENDTHKLLWDFDIQTDHLISARRPDLIIINKKKKKKICKIVYFTVPADHRIKLKECEKRVPRPCKRIEKKKQWNMKVTIILIVIGALGTVTKGLLKGLEDLEVGGRVETIQTTALLKTARRVLETWGDLLSLNLQWKTISLRWCENSNEQ